MFTKDSNPKWLLMSLVVLILIFLCESAYPGRANRKQSTSGPAQNSFRNNQRVQSQIVSRPSRPSVPSRQTFELSRNTPQIPNRTNSSIANRYRIPRQSGTSGENSSTTLSNRRIISNSLPPRSGINNSGVHSSIPNNRVSRKANSSLSQSFVTARPDRIIRRSRVYNRPISGGTIYNYRRDYYPYSRIFYRVTWPDCYRPIYYSWGPCYSIGYFWPYYHRKYVFVSLGGYWPSYSYRRYYWYGCHPYRWYGYYPPKYTVTGNTYNYYYYNTYPTPQNIVNNNRTQLGEEPEAEPAQESQSDRLFTQAVNAFENKDYNTAAAKFNEASVLSPNDIVLPFAYVQALFANGQYELAARNLHEALKKSSPDKEGVFYPRGLYSDESILQQQIDTLKRTIILVNPSAEMELLLGYQLLGTGKLDEAAGHLEIAASDENNNEAATMFIKLLEKLKKADEQQTQQTDNPLPHSTAEK